MQHLRLAHPGLDFHVDVKLRPFEGRWLATADLAEDRPDVGSGDTPREAIRDALRALGEQYASDMGASAWLTKWPLPVPSLRFGFMDQRWGR